MRKIECTNVSHYVACLQKHIEEGGVVFLGKNAPLAALKGLKNILKADIKAPTTQVILRDPSILQKLGANADVISAYSKLQIVKGKLLFVMSEGIDITDEELERICNIAKNHYGCSGVEVILPPPVQKVMW